MIELRPYQAAAVEALRSHVRAGRRRVLLQLPTGGGKTVLASSIIHSARVNYDARVLFFAHRLELVNQTVRQLAKWGVTEVGVMRGKDARTDATQPVQVGTVQTLSRRTAPAADIVFVDEAHRAAGDTYRRVLEAYPEATIIGLSATPCRLDGKPLGDVFEALEKAGTYAQLMADGFVEEPVVYSTPVRPDLSAVHTRMGDYVEGELEEAMMQPSIIGSIVGEWQKHAGGRRTVVYAVTVAHSQEIVRRFCDAGIAAEHLDGTTPEDERAAILDRVERGDTLVVSNCAVLTEGWDCPPVKCVVMARPTKSLALYMQCVGRALRPWGGVRPVVLDHGDNVGAHGLPTEDRAWTLDGGAQRREGAKNEFHMCKGCYGFVKLNPCELCGYEAPREVRKIEEAAHVELAPVTGRPKVEDRRGYYDEQLARARREGFKVGFAAAKYKEKYNEWPPWSWSQEAKALFAKDEGWQARQADREREREFWQARAEPPPEAPVVAEPYYTEPPAEVPAEWPSFWTSEGDANEVGVEEPADDFLTWLENA